MILDKRVAVILPAYNAAETLEREISRPTRYSPDSSSINLAGSVRYGLGVITTSVLYRLQCWRLFEVDFLADEPSQRLKTVRLNETSPP